jgi:hypothetical protein
MSATLRRTVRLVVIAVVAVSLSGCDFGDWILQVLNSLGMAPRHEVRIAGSSYFTLDKQDGGDSSAAGSGFLCVIHNPGCNTVFSSGNDGKDAFFLRQILPPGATLEGIDFTQIKPAGLSTIDPGGINGYGSYGASVLPGLQDGAHPIYVKWNNACQGAHAGKNVAYQVSFRLSVIDGTEDTLNEPVADMSQAPPACASDLANPPPQQAQCTPGELSHLTVALTPAAGAAGGLVYTGSTANGLNSPCTNRLQSFSVGQSAYRIGFVKSAQSGCANPVAELGPGGTSAPTDSNDSEQTALFGEPHPVHPITFFACPDAGSNAPSFITIFVTLQTQ